MEEFTLNGNPIDLCHRLCREEGLDLLALNAFDRARLYGACFDASTSASFDRATDNAFVDGFGATRRAYDRARDVARTIAAEQRARAQARASVFDFARPQMPRLLAMGDEVDSLADGLRDPRGRNRP